MDILSSIKAISCLIVLLSFGVSIAVDSPAQSLSIRDGTTFVSQGGNFELGFFSPGTSKNRYLGIWYKDIPIQTVVWVANGLTPIGDSSGSLTLNSTGHLVLSQNNTVVWHTSLLNQAQNPVVQLLDSGNLVVRDKNEADPEAYLWQSFDYPSDTMLPGMKFGWDLKHNINRRFTAWKSPDDPAPGDFYFTIKLNDYPDFYMMKGMDEYFRTGPWNGLGFSGSPELKTNPLFNYSFVHNQDEVYYTFNLKSNSVISRLVMEQTNYVRRRYVWTEDIKSWKIYSTVPQDYCDTYALCGANGNCMITNSPVCDCLEGFKPKLPQNWNSMDWSAGCVRKKPLGCKDQQEDGFAKMVGLKLPDTTHTWLDTTMNLEQCRQKCLKNCSCMAHANSDITGQGSGCVLWFGDLIDIREFAAGGQDLYVRMAASELESRNGGKRRLTVIVTTIMAAIFGLLLVGCCYIHKVRRKRTVIPHSLKSRSFFSNLPEKSKNKDDGNSGGNEDDLDLPVFDLSTIATATNNFSMENKIGEGGFGPVYKGRLEHGQEIAVKRLSKSSGQGMIEFKNEVKLIAKLQHRNLVKLLGCCIQEQEKMLVYEYMPNSSLDTFIFDPAKSKVLYWHKRYQIICGIARGLLYLHQDSRLRIIHRDLKASNVLLDANLNPKISDFGMARIFGGDQMEGNTSKVVGTYGYMAPEYAADGLFSVKSDVFSFGILLFEIISGKRNRGFHHADQTHNLISRAWSLWKEGRALELIDQNMGESCNLAEVLRCLHVSLLCVQQHPEDRPNMSSVVLMLGSEIELPRPKQPAFFVTKDSSEITSCSSQHEVVSTNEMTITQLDAR